MTQERPYTTISSRYLWQSRWYNVRQDQLRSVVNGDHSTYTVIEKPGAVWVVPVTIDRQVVLINQYRYAVDDWCLEVPAGNIEPGMNAHTMAARELHEETGGIAERLVSITEFYTMNGIGNGVAHVFVALGVTLGEPQPEATEHIRQQVVSIEEVLTMARTGVIKDGPSALAILLSEAALRDYLAE